MIKLNITILHIDREREIDVELMYKSNLYCYMIAIITNFKLRKGLPNPIGESNTIYNKAAILAYNPYRISAQSGQSMVLFMAPEQALRALNCYMPLFSFFSSPFYWPTFQVTFLLGSLSISFFLFLLFLLIIVLCD